MKLNACIISFGPIRSKCNGYFVRVWNILKEASCFYGKVVVLEFSEENIIETNKLRNVTFIQLHGNELVSKGLTNFFKKIATFDPFQSLRFQILSFAQLWRYRKCISSSDIVIIEGSLIPAGNILAKLLGKKVILDTHGVQKLLASYFRKRKIMAYFFRTLFWDLLERVTMKLSDVVVTVSEKERDFVITEYHIPQYRVSIVPNVVRIEKPAKRHGSVEALRKKLGLENRIVVSYLGDLRIVQNTDAVEYITRTLAQKVWDKRKDVSFLILGKGKEIFTHTSLPNVFFAGFVEDVATYLEMSDVCIAPLRVGCGVKTKIMEYLIHGKPIVATDIGAEGLEPIISNLNQEFVRFVPLKDFPETLLDMVSYVIKRKPIDIQVNPEIFTESFKEKIAETFNYARKI